MQTFNRICIKTHKLVDGNGNEFTLKRGQEYLTSSVDKSNDVMIFSNYWVHAPVSIFAGEIEFTPSD